MDKTTSITSRLSPSPFSVAVIDRVTRPIAVGERGDGI